MRRFGFMCFILFSLSAPLFARKNDWGEVEKLKRGTRIQVELWSGPTLSGRLESADVAGLRLTLNYPWQGTPVEQVFRSDIRTVVRVRRRVLPDPDAMLIGGALVGGAAGATAVAITDRHDCQGCKGFHVVAGGAGGAFLGFIGAAMIETGFGISALFHRDSVVYEDRRTAPYRPSSWQTTQP